MKTDLSTLSIKELKKLAKDVEKAIALTEARQRKDARSAMEKIAKEYGVSVEEVLKGDTPTQKSTSKPKPKTAKKRQAKPKYRNPEDASQTWSGQGRRPGWYVAAIEAGKTQADLAI